MCVYVCIVYMCMQCTIVYYIYSIYIVYIYAIYTYTLICTFPFNMVYSFYQSAEGVWSDWDLNCGSYRKADLYGLEGTNKRLDRMMTYTAVTSCTKT